jgi:phosphohistidine phosphatase
MTHLNKLSKNIHTAVIICHNPSITNFVNTYTDSLIDNVPTTGAVLITFDSADWASVRAADYNGF